MGRTQHVVDIAIKHIHLHVTVLAGDAEFIGACRVAR
jgi:hypothetical protein